MHKDFVDMCGRGSLAEIVSIIEESVKGDASSICDVDLNEGFRVACCNGKVDIVDYLATGFVGKKINGKNIKDSFKWACFSNELEVARYLYLSKAGMEFIDVGDVNEALSWACGNGAINVVEYLLTSGEVREEIKTDNDELMIGAVSNNQLDMVKYLVESKELKDLGYEWSLDDKVFMCAYSAVAKGILRYFIFDLEMKKTDVLRDFLLNNDYLDINKMFEIRDLRNNLDKQMEKSVVTGLGKMKI